MTRSRNVSLAELAGTPETEWMDPALELAAHAIERWRSKTSRED